jgi:phosphatidate cytidylyltransferase
MSLWPAAGWIFGGLYATLVLASLIGFVSQKRYPGPGIAHVNARIRGWWIMITIMGLGLLAGPPAIFAFFILVSLQGLREFGALTPLTALLVAAQYGVVIAGLPPIVVLPALLAPRQRWALLLAVAGPAHIPALHPLLMVFLVLIAQASDVFQFLAGKALGRHKLAPTISPNKTVEGLLGGLLGTAALGAGVHWLTPFPWPTAAALAAAIAAAGVAGGLLLSAMKRRRGLKDWGQMIQGHGGVLDRADSICLSAPLLYYLLRLL